MLHEMKLREIYFNMIKSGEKIYEIRLNDEKRRMIDVGDVIVFKKEPDLTESLQTVVEDLIYFDTFSEMINTLPLDKIGFAGDSKQNIEDVYHSFYPITEEIKYGVVAIKIKVMKA